MTLKLALLPFGATDKSEMAWLSSRLSERGFACTVVPEAVIAAEAFDPEREQYRAELMLAATRRLVSGRVLGVVDADLYAEGLNFVFGMAEHPGRVAVIALPRLRLGADEAVYRDRMLKEAVHELGHTLGLAHCQRSKCVMHFSNCLADTNRKGSDYCADCRGKLAALLGHCH